MNGLFLVSVKEDLPTKHLEAYGFPDDIEVIAEMANTLSVSTIITESSVSLVKSRKAYTL